MVGCTLPRSGVAATQRTMKVSILIPCYNAERWIGEAIDSALAQDYRHKEIIVVDDGSTDGSRKIVASFGQGIRTELTPNRGGNAARNRLLEMSSGEWLQFLDADDYLLPGKISSQIEALRDFEGVDVLCGPAWMRTEGAGNPDLTLMEIPEPRDPWVLLASWLLPQTGAPLWRKAALLDVGGWNEEQTICQEHELYLRLLKANKCFRFNKVSGAVYRHWSEDTVCRRDKRSTYAERVRIVDLAEEHLRVTGTLTAERLDAINQTRFICARILWGLDRKWSQAVIESVFASAVDFSPSVASTPLFYRLLFRYIGFESAEIVAARMRFLHRQPF